MGKEVVSVPKMSKYPLPFSPAIKAGDYIFVSGQPGFADASGKEVSGIEAQTRQCLENVRQILEAAGSSLDDVVKVTVFLRDASYFAPMNEVYRSYFPKDHPARSTVVTGLVVPSMLVEIECMAYSAARGRRPRRRA